MQLGRPPFAKPHFSVKKSPLQVPHLPEHKTSTPLSALAKSPNGEQKIQPAGRTIQEEKTAGQTIQYEVPAGLTIQMKNLSGKYVVLPADSCCLANLHGLPWPAWLSLYFQIRHSRPN